MTDTPKSPTAASLAEAATLHRLHARAPSPADIASAAECATAGQHQTATDVTGRPCCVVCGRMG